MDESTPFSPTCDEGDTAKFRYEYPRLALTATTLAVAAGDYDCTGSAAGVACAQDRKNAEPGGQDRTSASSTMLAQDSVASGPISTLITFTFSQIISLGNSTFSWCKSSRWEVMSGMATCDATHSHSQPMLSENVAMELMKILLAADGSKFSDAATLTPASQFRAEGAEVLVLQAVEPLIYSAPPQMTRSQALEMAAKLRDQVKQAKETATRTAEVLQYAGFKAGSRVAENEIRTRILHIAGDWHADLIVLGSMEKSACGNSCWEASRSSSRATRGGLCRLCEVRLTTEGF